MRVGQGWSLLRDVLKLKPSHEVGAQPLPSHAWLCMDAELPVSRGVCRFPLNPSVAAPAPADNPERTKRLVKWLTGAKLSSAGLATEVRDSSRIHLFLDAPTAQPASGRATPASGADSGVDGRGDSDAGRNAEV